MKASIFIGTLGLAGLGIGLGQWAAPVAGSDPATLAYEGSVTTLRAETARRVDNDAEPEQQTATFSEGADIQYSDIHQILNHSAVGSIYAYSLGSRTCNLGDEYLIWVNNGSPGFASNAYRLHDGRLMQIGTGWVKHACCVSNVTHEVCGGLTCAPPGDPGLRPGCMDVYSASWNSNQARLGPRVNINPYTAQFAPLTSDSYNSITRRLQVHRSEMDLSNYPGALFFVEGVYVCTTSAQAGNTDNNATYRRVTVDQSSFAMTLAAEQGVSYPAIYAWKHHGLGVNDPDPTVKIVPVDLPNEGRFHAATRVSDNGDGTWRYEYAVYNLNSHQAAGSFSVKIGENVNITNVGFHSPPYHSGEQQDTTPWQHTITADNITWSTTETYAENPNANAVRWGSMYNFWFDADQPPVARIADIGVFIPGTDSSVSFATQGPDSATKPCIGDINDDGIVDGGDLLIMLSEWGHCPGCASDLNEDDWVDAADLLILLGNWGECP